MDHKTIPGGSVIITSYPKELVATPEYLAEMGLKPQRPVHMTVAHTNEDLLRQMSANLKTQDNSATQDPMFVVYEKLLIVGLEDGYQESWSWITDDDGDTEEADSDLVPVLTKLHDDCEPLVIGSRTYRKIGIKYVDKFCAAFLTRKGAEDYIACNGHNLTQPFIFVHSMHRNAEMIAVRNFFMQREG